MRRAASALLLALLAVPSGAHEEHGADGGAVVALPPLAGLRYDPPAPGSYELPPILTLDSPDLLSSFPRKSFVPATNDDYQPIVDTAKAIGLID